MGLVRVAGVRGSSNLGRGLSPQILRHRLAKAAGSMAAAAAAASAPRRLSCHPVPRWSGSSQAHPQVSSGGLVAPPQSRLALVQHHQNLLHLHSYALHFLACHALSPRLLDRDPQLRLLVGAALSASPRDLSPRRAWLAVLGSPVRSVRGRGGGCARARSCGGIWCGGRGGARGDRSGCVVGEG